MTPNDFYDFVIGLLTGLKFPDINSIQKWISELPAI